MRAFFLPLINLKETISLKSKIILEVAALFEGCSHTLDGKIEHRTIFYLKNIIL